MNKLMKEYLEFIKETPIEDISHIGNSEIATNFTKPEIKMLKSEKYEKRLRNAFSKTPFVFDIVFVYNKKFDASSEKHNINIKSRIPKNKSNLPSFKFNNEIIKSKPGVITFISQGNLSPTNRIPMTPWILAHKIAHAIERDQNFINLIIHDITLNELLYDILDKNKLDYNDSIFDNLFSFKSWKIGWRKLRSEMLTELVSLYLITGKIQFNKIGNIKIDNKLEKFFKKMNHSLFKVFKSLEGKILTEV